MTPSIPQAASRSVMAANAQMTRPIRIVVADDHPIFRAGLRALLDGQPDMQVVGEAGNGLEAMQRCRELKPDVVLLDLTMPVLDGLGALREMQRNEIPSRALVLTMHAENEYLLNVLEAGGYGYVLKQAVDTDLFEAIRTVARGEVFLYPAATTLLLSRYLEQKHDTEGEPEDGLSEREREVLVLTAEGYSSQEIGDRLALSAKTVETYRTRLMRKLNMHHRADLVQYALRSGLLRAHDGQS